MLLKASTVPNSPIVKRLPRTRSGQAGQASVEYLVATVFFLLAVAFVADPSMFGVNVDLLAAIKGYFKAFAYAISVVAT